MLLEVSHALYENCIFQNFNLYSDLKLQFTFLEFLEFLEENKFKPISSELFVYYVPKFLKWEYEFVFGKNVNWFIQKFKLRSFDSLLTFRCKCIKKLFNLYDDFSMEIKKFIKDYISYANFYYNDMGTAYANEKDFFFEFFNDKFDSNKYEDLVLIKQYLEMLQKYKIEIVNMDLFIKSDKMSFLNTYFCNDPYLKIEDLNKLNKRSISEDLKNKDLIYVKQILNDISFVSTLIDLNFLIPKYVFKSICENNLLCSSFKYYYSNNLLFELNGSTIKQILKFLLNKDSIDIKKLYNFFINYNNKNQYLYLQILFGILNKNLINLESLKLFIIFVKRADIFYLNNLENYTNFEDTFQSNKDEFNNDFYSHTNIITYITDICIQKNSERINVCDKFCKRYQEYFFKNKCDIKILKEIFFLESKNQLFDIKDMKIFLCNDKNFLIEYIKRKIDNNEIKFLNRAKGMSFIWDINGIENIILKSVNLINDQNYSYLDKNPINILFEYENDLQKEKIERFICSYIEKFHDNDKYMVSILNMAVNLFKENFWKFLNQYIKNQPKIESFKKINFRQKVRYGNELTNLQNDLKFIENIKYNVEALDSEKNWDYVDYLESLSHTLKIKIGII
ncbi:hypothetical protein ACA135_05855 [Methanobrevibacter acididurans]|uniref:hypothetical protein n=1 Tax=Methanobrevibacter acididurans TaxID=120963 RepID=UPI0038FCF305